jgi:LmbE family N-acetylglucosaminyl deacetylase
MNNLNVFGVETQWYRPQSTAQRLLIVYPHPDDETFGNGGTIAHYAAAGVGVHYACATRGECGSVDDALLHGYPNIAALRTAELDAAARIIGLAAIHYLNYRDSGMAGTADNRHPDAFAQAPLDAVTAKLVAIVRAIKPQVIVTFNAYGGYGHPDHIQSHRAALAAFSAAGDPARFPEQLSAGLYPYTPEKLYYSTFGAGWLRLVVRALRLFGRDPRRFGRNADVDLLRIAEEATPVTTTLEIGPFLARKEQATDCHRSQLHGSGLALFRRLPFPIRRLISGRESFTRVIPPVPPGARREHELF